VSSLLTTGVAWLHAQRRAHLVEAASYERLAGGAAIVLDATPIQVRYQRLDPFGMPVEAQMVDFLIDAADLAGTDPVAGDVIAYGGRRYEATPMGDDPCWRWSDSARTVYRIHTQDAGADT